MNKKDARRAGIFAVWDNQKLSLESLHTDYIDIDEGKNGDRTGSLGSY